MVVRAMMLSGHGNGKRIAIPTEKAFAFHVAVAQLAPPFVQKEQANQHHNAPVIPSSTGQVAWRFLWAKNSFRKSTSGGMAGKIAICSPQSPCDSSRSTCDKRRVVSVGGSINGKPHASANCRFFEALPFGNCEEIKKAFI